MIFWILLALAVAAVIATYIYWVPEEGWGFAFLPAALAVIIAGPLAFGLMMLAFLIPGDKVTDETHDLRAISSSSSVQGRFFLGSGYVDGKRTLNYIAQEDGYSRLGQGIASASRVYEDTDKPTVTEYTHWYSNGWVVPFDVKTGSAWDFHIPADSILEDFTITNE